MKPTDVGALWVHVTCAWFHPEVGFLDHEKMEPATGILRIPPCSFSKVLILALFQFLMYEVSPFGMCDSQLRGEKIISLVKNIFGNCASL